MNTAAKAKPIAPQRQSQVPNASRQQACPAARPLWRISVFMATSGRHNARGGTKFPLRCDEMGPADRLRGYHRLKEAVVIYGIG